MSVLLPNFQVTGQVELVAAASNQQALVASAPRYAPSVMLSAARTALSPEVSDTQLFLAFNLSFSSYLRSLTCMRNVPATSS
jgi:hypothetical protein